MKEGFSKEILMVVCREPYRLFFPLGIILGSFGVGHWLFYSLGWVESYSGFLHSSFQMMLYMNCFVLGFLLTAFPRFSKTPILTPLELFGFIFLMAMMVYSFTSMRWVAAEFLYVGWFGLLTSFVLKRVLKRSKTASDNSSSKAPKELIWIPIGILHGLIGSTLLMSGQLRVLPAWVISVGRPMMEQGFLLCVVVGIGSFLIPRLMGTYIDLDNKTENNNKPCCQICTQRKNKTSHQIILQSLLFGAGLFLSFWFQGVGWEQAGYFLRAGVITYVFMKANICFQKPKTKDLYVQLTWISAWMFLIGFWGAAFFPDYSIAMLHITFIGGLSLMTFTIGSMVILTHGGFAHLLKRSLWVLWFVFIGLGLVLFKRLLVIVDVEHYFKFLGLAAGMWIAVGGVWVVAMARYIFSVPDEDAFGNMHEAVKKKISQEC